MCKACEQSKPVYAQRMMRGDSVAKDSQLDPKKIREKKSKGGPTFAQSAQDGEGRTHKKQSASRHKPGNDK